MSLRGELLEMLEAVACALGEDLCAEMVFVGGCSTAVLITDEIVVEEVRATDDVDLILSLSNPMDWGQFQARLMERGFTVSGEDDVVCRMRLNEIKVDFMPDNEAILGFTNRWYRLGIRTSIDYVLPSGRSIRHLTAPLFLATKFEAYRGRGKNDPLASHDLEDILLLIDGRETLPEEVRSADREVSEFIAEECQSLMNHRDFEHFLAGNIAATQDRVEVVRARMATLAASAD